MLNTLVANTRVFVPISETVLLMFMFQLIREYGMRTGSVGQH